MQGLPAFNPRSDAPKRRDEPGKGDDVPCVKCGGALDTGLECPECGHDNYAAVTGKPFKQLNAQVHWLKHSRATQRPLLQYCTRDKLHYEVHIDQSVWAHTHFLHPCSRRNREDNDGTFCYRQTNRRN